MKTLRKTLWALALVANAVSVTWVVACRRQAASPLDGLYARYSHCDGLAVALVRGKGIPCGPSDGDSVRVDLLMLTAADSAAWQRLRADFGVPQPLPPMQQRIDRGSDIVSVRRLDQPDPQSTGEYIRVACYLHRQVSIINAPTAADIDLIRHYHMEQNIKL